MATLNIKRKGQSVINAIVYDGTNFAELQALAPTIQQFGANVGFTTVFGTMEAAPGMYVIKDNGNFSILDQTEFDIQFALINDEAKGRLVVDNLMAQLKQANLTSSEKSQLVTKLSSVFIALVIGELNGARFLANNLTTDTVFTAGRKTYLLNLIDSNL